MKINNNNNNNNNNNIDAVYLFCVTGIIRSISLSKGGLFSVFLLVSQASSLSRLSPPVKNNSLCVPHKANFVEPELSQLSG